jgi:hypothetical protein
MIDINVNSEGTFSIEELVLMPSYYISEILESFKSKKERNEQAVNSASGKNTRTF